MIRLSSKKFSDTLLVLSLLLILFGFLNTAHADAEGQMWGRKAGDYYSAVIMANEFKKTPCGQYLNVPDSWADVGYARQNILKKLPVKYHREFNAAFTESYELDIRKSVRKDLYTSDKSKCKELASGVKDLIAPRIYNW